jgi:putative iron-dependent peroxidase
MSEAQPGILAPLPRHARYVWLRLRPGADPRTALTALAARPADGSLVLGIGLTCAKALGAEPKGLAELPAHAGSGFSVPSTPAALWGWLRGEDRGELVHASRALAAAAAPAFEVTDVVDAFQFLDSRDLSGYVDGTENPKDDDAVAAAIASGQGAGLDGSSFVAVQQWVHDLDLLAAMAPAERDAVFGRRHADNEEIEDAPASAHVKRTAQEDFQPPAFMLRRSMPFADARREGLVFVAFGHSLDAFVRQLRRMAGAEDGIADALFRFTRPVSSASFWCPPVARGRLDLRALGL